MRSINAHDRHSKYRVPVVALATALVAGGCSLLPGGDDEPEPAPSTTKDAQPAVAWTTAKASEVKKGGTLRLGLPALPANFNPAHVSNIDAPLDDLLAPTTGSAIRTTADGGWEVDENYAESVEVADESPLTIEVKLNPEAVWQGGSPITGDDMAAYVDARDGSDDKYQSGRTDGFDDIESVDVGDDKFEYTVTFDKPRSDWPLFIYPALPGNLSENAKSFNGEYVNKATSANGPFFISAIDRERGRVEMQRNPRWWGKTPRLEKITYQAARADVQLEALAAGELDIIDVPSTIQSAAAQEDLGDASLQVAAGTEWTQLTMNGGRGPLKDVAVRRAIARAIDRSELAALSSKAVDVPATLMGSFVFLPGQKGYFDQGKRIAYNVDEAKALLDEAGWKAASEGAVRQKDGKPLELVMPVPATTASSKARADLIVSQLKEVGVAVKLDAVPDDKFFTDRVIPLDFDLATFTNTGSPYPVVSTKDLFYPIDSPRNFTGTEDGELSKAWNKAIAALDDTERFRIVGVLDKRLFRDVPIVPLGLVPQVRGVRDDVVNAGASQFQKADWTIVGFRAEK